MILKSFMSQLQRGSGHPSLIIESEPFPPIISSKIQHYPVQYPPRYQPNALPTNWSQIYKYKKPHKCSLCCCWLSAKLLIEFQIWILSCAIFHHLLMRPLLRLCLVTRQIGVCRVPEESRRVFIKRQPNNHLELSLKIVKISH